MPNTHSVGLASASSQYLSRSSSSSLRQKGDFTLEGWVKFTSLPGSGSNMWIIDKKSESGEDFSVYAIYLNNTSGTYYLKLRTTNGSSASLNDQAVTWTPSTDTWYHIAVTRLSSGGTIKFYINGSQQGSDQTGYSGTLHDNSDLGFYLGRYKSADGRYLNGRMDDWRVWSVVRTQTQISDNKSKELVGDETNLQGYWKFNNALTDSTANANTLTNNNSATFSTDVPFVGSTDYDESYTETSTFTDTPVISHGQSKTLSEVATFADATVDTQTGKAVNVSESATFTEATVTRDTSKVFSESVTNTDTLSTLKGYVREFTESLTFIDTKSVISVINIVISELLAFTDILGSVKSLWTKRTKPTTNWTDRSKPTTNWTDRSKPT